jgi:membrane protein implicated in regulation of membrane protease activity
VTGRDVQWVAVGAGAVLAVLSALAFPVQTTALATVALAAAAFWRS